MTRLQYEEGTKAPLRPRTVTLDMAAGFAPPNDPPAVDWTAAGTRLVMTIDQEFMDDSMGHRGVQMTLNTPAITLGPGIWEVRMEVVVDNITAGDEGVQLAITNGAGTTIHAESGTATVPLSSALTLGLTALVHHPAGGVAAGVNDVVFRAAQVTGAGTDLLINADRIGVIRKIGNANEV